MAEVITVLSVASRAFYGASVANTTPMGGGAAMPMFDGVMSGTGDFISSLSAIQAKGARVIMQFPGAASNYKDANSAFSLAMWKARMDIAFARTSPQQMGNFVQDGTLLCNWMIDDFKQGSNVFSGGVPTYEDLEAMAAYSKSVWTLVPCMARAENQYLKSICVAAGASTYTYVDFGWAQWHRRFGAALAWFTNHVNDGRSVGLGALFGYNLLNGGSGITAPWNVHPDLGAPNFGMSPQEIDACTDAFSALTYAIGVNVWAQNPSFDGIDYWHVASIQTAMLRTASAADGRLAGPINWRDVSGQTSGSTQAVAGNWSFLGWAYDRSNNLATTNSDYPASVPVNALLGALAYSRDSGKASTQPSGWSTAFRISGSSAQGGDLALYYKLADGTEAGTQLNIDWSGSVTDAAIQVVTFAFSGNTTRSQAALLAAVGSGATWVGGTADMGPVPGIQSTVSDSLILVCAAKTNDYANGFPVPDGTMSATTSDGESWNRMMLLSNGQGSDSATLIDYAITSGLPSIDTKSWSQISGNTGTGAQGPGSGIMVAFAPAGIVAGQPPSITELADITLSLSSTLSFLLDSTGSTPITWSRQSGPSTVTINSTTGAFQWTPGSVGTYVIVVKASNSFGSDTASFTAFAVAGGNRAPSITHPGNKTVAAHDLLSFLVGASDPDSDPISFTLETAPDGAFIDDTTGQFIWIPTGEQGPGTYPVVVLVSDGQNESRSTFTVTVTDTAWTRAGGPSTQLQRPNLAASGFAAVTPSVSGFTAITPSTSAFSRI